MRDEPRVVALLTSDWHLSLKAPIYRSCEEDWLEVQAGYLDQLSVLSESPGSIYSIPILHAGDVFDKWNSSAELINWSIQHMPNIYAIPGQHDLPNHSYEDIKRSAYWTLVEAGKINNLSSERPRTVGDVTVWPFPWGKKIEPLWDVTSCIGLQVALVHKYVWKPGHSYSGAPTEGRVKNLLEDFKRYDLAVIGDNHSPFFAKCGDCLVWNCGSFMRRKRDEKSYVPRVGLLMSDGTVKEHKLDTSKDKFLSDEEVCSVLEDELDARDFLGELSQLDGTSLDFVSYVKREIEKRDIREGVKRQILKAIGERE